MRTKYNRWNEIKSDQFLEDNWEKVTYKCKLLPSTILINKSKIIYNWYQGLIRLGLDNFLQRNKIKQWSLSEYKNNEEHIEQLLKSYKNKITKNGEIIQIKEIMTKYPKVYNIYQYINSPRCKIYKNFDEVCEKLGFKRNGYNRAIDWTKKENIDNFINNNIDNIVINGEIIKSTEYKNVFRMVGMIRKLNEGKNEYYKSGQHVRKELGLPILKTGKKKV